MFDLLLTVTLNPLHQALHRQVLLLTELLGLTLHLLHYLKLILRHFVHFLLIGFHSHELSIIVLFDSKENLLLVPQSHQVFMRLVFHLTSDFVQQGLLFMVLLLTHVLNQLKSSCFIRGHILVPRLRKFLELHFLSVFDIQELFLLSDAHVLLLALLLSF